MMYSDTVSILKLSIKIISVLYFVPLRCETLCGVSSSSILIFLSYLFSPSNFFLLMIWNVRCLNGQHGSLMLIFGVENPSSLQPML